MTVTTMLWATNGVGDAPTAPAGYTDEQTQQLFKQIVMGDATAQGVLAGYGNALEATHDTANEIDVDTGFAIINGIHFENDTEQTLTLTSVAADTAGLVFAEVNYSTQTGRISYTQQTSGNTTIPSLTQSGAPSGVWQIALAEYILDSSGDVWTDTGKGTAGPKDRRRFVTSSNGELIGRQGGSASDWSTSGTTDYVVGRWTMQMGHVTWTGSDTSGTVAITFPEAFSAKPIVFSKSTGTGQGTGESSVTSTGFDLNWVDINGDTITSLPLKWLAVGPA